MSTTTEARIVYDDRFDHLYVLGRKLGEGVYGVVRLAKRREVLSAPADISSSESKLACKIVSQSTDFLRELFHLLVLQECPAVLPLQRVVFSPKQMLMEFQAGASFADYVDTVVHPNLHSRLQFCLHMCQQLLLLLDAVHSNGIVHRDITPANLLLRENDAGDVIQPLQPLLIDFGFSKTIVSLRAEEDTTVGDGSSASTNRVVQSAYDVCSAAYRAPELFRLYKNSRYCCTVDEWSVGCILYECFTGVTPFETLSVKDAHIRARLASYVWHVTGRKPFCAEKGPYNPWRAWLDCFRRSGRSYPGERTGGSIRNQEMVSFRLLSAIVKRLLHPFPSKRWFAHQLLARFFPPTNVHPSDTAPSLDVEDGEQQVTTEVVTRSESEYETSSETTHTTTVDSSDSDAVLQPPPNKTLPREAERILKEFFVICDRSNNVTATLYYQTVDKWFHLLGDGCKPWTETGFWTRNQGKSPATVYRLLLFASCKVVAGYFGFYDDLIDQLWKQFCNIEERRTAMLYFVEIVRYFAQERILPDDWISFAAGECPWLALDHDEGGMIVAKDEWNTIREKRNTVKLLRQWVAHGGAK